MSPKWLICCELSAETEASAISAAKEGFTHGAELLLLHVVLIPSAVGPFDVLVGESPYAASVALRDSLLEEARTHLQRILAELGRILPGLKATLMVVEGEPVQETLRVAKEQKVDLIAVGTHSRKGMEHFLLGSVSEKIVRLSPISVLVVKEKIR